MPPIICAVDEAGSEDAVDAAIEFCREHDVGLRLVGIVRDNLAESTRSPNGERIARYTNVKLALDRAAERACQAGVAVTTNIRAGDPLHELVQEADAAGSGELFFVRSRSRIGAALRRAPKRELAHLSMAPSTVRRLARAA
jgi:nucleotide-binding universal stress UspA family protein